MKKYTLEDVQEAAASIQDFITENLGKNEITNPLLMELAPLNYAPTNFEEAIELNRQMKEIEIRHHKTVMAELKAMKNNSRWVGTYIVHDLICDMAHFGFTLRYAMKDTEGTEDDG